MAAKMAKVFRQHGATRVVEAFGDDVKKGEVTDFFRAVKAEDGENVVFSFIEWPDKQTRDEAWGKIMSDETIEPNGGHALQRSAHVLGWLRKDRRHRREARDPARHFGHRLTAAWQRCEQERKSNMSDVHTQDAPGGAHGKRSGRHPWWVHSGTS